MSLIKSVLEVEQARRVVVSGFPGSGKTTLSVSASKFAGDKLPSVKVECTDVVVLNGDSEGYYGAIDCGLTPMVIDFTDIDGWDAYSRRLAEAVKDIAASDIQYIIVDMALPAKLIIDKIAPTQISDWGKVAAQGLAFYKAFGALRGKTIIANTQVKPSAAAVENDAAKQASEAKAIGGERATYSLDLPKGIAGPWIENSSLMLAREVKKIKDEKTKVAKGREYFTHTSASSRLEVKSRFASKLAPVLPGDMTLNAILNLAYGK